MNILQKSMDAIVNVIKTLPRKKFEVVNGRFLSSELKTNEIGMEFSLIKYFLVNIICNFFLSINNTASLILLFISSFTNPHIYHYALFLGPLIFYYTSHVLLEIYKKNKKMHIYTEINKMEVTTVNMHSGRIQKVEWKDIKEGDFIILRKNENSPADLLILENSNNKCLINNEEVLGKTSPEERIPLSNLLSVSTRVKGSPMEYRRILNGKLELVDDQETEENFRGYLKLSRDPRGIEITRKNLIFRHESPISSEWVFGIALNVGRNCLIHRNEDKIKHSLSLHITPWDIFTLIIFVIITLQLVIANTVLQQTSEVGYYNSLSFHFGTYLVIMSGLLSPVVPFARNIINLLSINRFLRENKSRDSAMNIINFEKVPLLGQIDYVIFGKSGVLTKPDSFKLRSLIINKKLFSFEENDDPYDYENIKSSIDPSDNFTTLAQETFLSPENSVQVIQSPGLKNYKYEVIDNLNNGDSNNFQRKSIGKLRFTKRVHSKEYIDSVNFPTNQTLNERRPSRRLSSLKRGTSSPTLTKKTGETRENFLVIQKAGIDFIDEQDNADKSKPNNQNIETNNANFELNSPEDNKQESHIESKSNSKLDLANREIKSKYLEDNDDISSIQNEIRNDERASIEKYEENEIDEEEGSSKKSSISNSASSEFWKDMESQELKEGDKMGKNELKFADINMKKLRLGDKYETENEELFEFDESHPVVFNKSYSIHINGEDINLVKEMSGSRGELNKRFDSDESPTRKKDKKISFSMENTKNNFRNEIMLKLPKRENEFNEDMPSIENREFSEETLVRQRKKSNITGSQESMDFKSNPDIPATKQKQKLMDNAHIFAGTTFNNFTPNNEEERKGESNETFQKFPDRGSIEENKKDDLNPFCYDLSPSKEQSPNLKFSISRRSSAKFYVSSNDELGNKNRFKNDEISEKKPSIKIENPENEATENKSNYNRPQKSLFLKKGITFNAKEDENCVLNDPIESNKIDQNDKIQLESSEEGNNSRRFTFFNTGSNRNIKFPAIKKNIENEDPTPRMSNINEINEEKSNPKIKEVEEEKKGNPSEINIEVKEKDEEKQSTEKKPPLSSGRPRFTLFSDRLKRQKTGTLTPKEEKVETIETEKIYTREEGEEDQSLLHKTSPNETQREEQKKEIKAPENKRPSLFIEINKVIENRKEEDFRGFEESKTDSKLLPTNSTKQLHLNLNSKMMEEFTHIGSYNNLNAKMNDGDFSNVYNLHNLLNENDLNRLTLTVQVLLLTRHPKFALPEDKMIEEFCSRIGVHYIEPAFNEEIGCSCYGISMKNKNLYYNIVGINKTSINRKRFSVLLQAESSKLFYLLVKGPPEDMMSRIIHFDSFYSDFDSLPNLIDRQKYIGIEATIYGFRELKEIEVDNYRDRLSSFKSNYQNTDLMDNYFSELETDLYFVTSMTFSEVIEPKANVFIQKIKKITSKRILITGDTDLRTLNCASSLNLLGENSQTFNFRFKTVEEGKISIKNGIAILKKSFGFQNESNNFSNLNSLLQLSERKLQEISTTKSTKFKFEIDPNIKFSAIIDGASMEILKNNIYLKTHFCFLLYFSETVVGYNFSKKDKETLVSLIKEYIPNSPKILNVGSTFIDFSSNFKTDISIGICRPPKKQDLRDSIFERQKRASIKQIDEENLEEIKKLTETPSKIKSIFSRHKTENKSQDLKKNRKSQVNTDFTNINYMKPSKRLLPPVDIMCSKIDGVSELIFLMANETLIKQILISFMILFYILMSSFEQYFFLMFSRFSGQVAFEEMHYLTTFHIKGIILAIVIPIFSKNKFTNQLMNRFPTLYNENKYLQGMKLKVFFFELLVPSAIVPLINFLIIELMTEVQSNIGVQYPYESIKLLYIFCNNAFFIIYIWTITNKKIGLIWFCFSVGFTLASLISAQSMRTNDSTFLVDRWSFFQSFFRDSIFLVFVMIFILFINYSFLRIYIYVISKIYKINLLWQKLIYLSQCPEKKLITIKDKISNFFKSNKLQVYDFLAAEYVFKFFKGVQPDPLIQESIFSLTSVYDPMEIEGQDNAEFKKYSLKFVDSSLNINFWKNRLQSNISNLKRIYGFILILAMIINMKEIIINELARVSSINVISLLLGIISVILYSVYLILIFTDVFIKKYRILSTAIVLTFLGNSIFVSIFYSQEDYNIFIPICFMYFISHIVHYPFFIIGVCLAIYLKTCIIIIYILVSKNLDIPNRFILFSYIVLLFGIFLSRALNYYKIELNTRKEFLVSNKMDYQTKMIKDILSILLPKFIKDQMDQGQKSIKEDQGEVVVIFCDICNFTEMIAEIGTGIVELLDTLFRKFDDLSSNHGAQKIETVGKTYMASTGIPACESNLPRNLKNIEKTLRAINLGLDMLKACKKMRWGNDSKSIIVKVGVHVGKVVAGVIGYHKPQFSLIGDTVNTTSRVCTLGEDNKVTISADAWQKVKDCQFFFLEKKVEAKGKGLISTYQVYKTKKEFQTAMDLLKKKPKLEKKVSSFNRGGSQRKKQGFGAAAKTVLKSKFFNKNSIPNQNPITSDEKPKLLEESQTPSLNKAIDIRKDASERRETEYFTVETPNNSQLKNEKERLSLIFKKENEDVQNELEVTYIKMAPNVKLTSRNSDTSFSEDEQEIQMKAQLEDNQELLKSSKYLLRLNNNEQCSLVQQFLMEVRNKHFWEDSYAMFIVAFIYILVSAFHLPSFISDKGYSWGYFVFRVIFALLMIIFVFLKQKIESVKVFKYFIFANYFFLLIYPILSFSFIRNHMINKSGTLETIFIQILFSNLSLLMISDDLLIVLAIFIVIIIFGIVSSECKHFFDEYFLLYVIIILINMLQVYLRQKNEIKNFNTIRTLENQKRHQSNMLKHLLPSHILEKYLNDPQKNLDLTEELDDVCILFADIAGFTAYSATVQPEDVVTMLSELFTEFDKMCLQNNVYKVYTIGDCYVVLGVVDAKNRNSAQEAKNVVNLAFDMLNIIKGVREKINFHSLGMRIGIHLGSLIGGIIGTDIVRYDIYGADVIIANKLESYGTLGKILISEDLKNLLERNFLDHYYFEFNASLYIATIDKSISSYFISAIEEYDDYIDMEN